MEDVALQVTTTGLTRLMNSEAPVIVVLTVLVVGMAYVCYQLYKKSDAAFEGRFVLLENELKACRSQHLECERHTKVLAEAVLSAVKGDEEKARIRAQFVLSKVIPE